MHISSYLHIFAELIRVDLLLFKQSLFNKLINVSIWIVLTIITMAYIMPFFGLSGDFGPFQFAGTLGAIGLFDGYACVAGMVADLEGDRVINYNLTLPLPSWMAILSKATYLSITYIILTLFMLPIGKLTLWNQLNLAEVSWAKLLLVILVENIFYAALVIWLTSFITMPRMEDAWARFVFPMWFMGGFQFSWKALYSFLPSLAFVSLINPMIYITEAIRVALIGPEGLLNFWICFGAILCFALLFLVLGIRGLKKRLDFV